MVVSNITVTKGYSFCNNVCNVDRKRPCKVNVFSINIKFWIDLVALSARLSIRMNMCSCLLCPLLARIKMMNLNLVYLFKVHVCRLILKMAQLGQTTHGQRASHTIKCIGYRKTISYFFMETSVFIYYLFQHYFRIDFLMWLFVFFFIIFDASRFWLFQIHYLNRKLTLLPNKYLNEW